MSEREFKVGELAECINTGEIDGVSCGGLTLGKKYLVIELDPIHVRVTSDYGHNFAYYRDRFRPAPAETREVVVEIYSDNWADGSVVECCGDKAEWVYPSGRRSDASHNMNRKECEYHHSIRPDTFTKRTVIRPAPAPAKAEAEESPVIPMKTGSMTQAELDTVLGRQPHEPENIALMRPEELRQFRAGQEKREREFVAAMDRAAELAGMEHRENAVRATTCPVALAAYRALCCEKGGGE